MINNDQRHSICEIIIILAIIAIVVYIIIHNGGGLNRDSKNEHFDIISSIEAGKITCNTLGVSTSSIASIIDIIYPVGSIYISINTANPKDLFGVGIWQHLPADKYLRTLTDGNTAESGLCGGGDTIEEKMLPKHSHLFDYVDTIGWDTLDGNKNEREALKSCKHAGEDSKKWLYNDWLKKQAQVIDKDVSITSHLHIPSLNAYRQSWVTSDHRRMVYQHVVAQSRQTGNGEGFYPSFIRIHAWKRTA